jgi:hypothetical protein
MDHYFGVAFYESIWRSLLALVIGIILIACFGSSLSSALQIGAHVALLFAILMVRNAFQLSQMLAEYIGTAPERWTQSRPAALMLQFAKAGSGIAVGLYSAALIT